MDETADLVVTIQVGHERIACAKRISGQFYLAYEPVKFCDDVMVAIATGSRLMNEVRIVAKRRKHYADLLAKELSTLLVESMAKKDTFNGYPIEDDHDR